ncbi:putative isoflavone reductase like protein [Amylocarpus encephaloides]|uniref:Isoflavone reductase like protein n=1 Tax=Amylocarpus encephaloides TaxID=45428 RepID=A0A9P8C3K8_9HELO|nr:putative isoflavone reductase like protein [Amylocarpus encephaloides]
MMSQTKENLLVFGATGYIGTYIIDKIVENKSSFGRIVVFTSPRTSKKKGGTVEKLKSEGVEVIVGDASKEAEVVKSYEGICTVVSAVGRTAIAEQIKWIDWAQQVPSVKWFFPSEYGTDIEYGPSSKDEPPHQQKLKVRAALRAASHLVHTFVVTGPYADSRNGTVLGIFPPAPELGGFDVRLKNAILTGDGMGQISLTTLGDVGKLVVLALLHPEASKNRALRVNSFTATGHEILAEFERQIGGEKWTVSYTSLERLRELEKEAYANNAPAATLCTLRRIWAEGGTLYEKRDNGLVDGEDTETLSDSVREAISFQSAA